MNIFKILANGDGSINEPNVSAFLGYLLNPYEDHGLGFEFLSRFLENVGLTEDANTASAYEYEIAFEAAFQDKESDNKKQIVDIVIVRFEAVKSKESYIRDLLSNNRKLNRVFLIENKIRKGTYNEKQIDDQFTATCAALKKIPLQCENPIEDMVASILVAPNEIVGKASVTPYKIAWEWKEDSTENSILQILWKLLEEERKGKIEAINEYTRHTLISFAKFVENNFKSQVEEKKDLNGKYQKDLYGDYNAFYAKYKSELDDASWTLINDFTACIKQSYPKYAVRHSKTHPIAVLTNPKSGKIFGITWDGKKLLIDILVGGLDEMKIQHLKEYLKEQKITYKIADSKRYFRTSTPLTYEQTKELFNFHSSLLKN